MLSYTFRRSIFALGAAVLSTAAQAASTTVTVSGSNNPFLAGQPSGTGCCSGDSAPAQSPTLAVTGFASGSVFTFSGIGGFNYQPGAPFGLDGDYVFNMDAANFGISGAQNVRVSALVGVFLDSSIPGGAAPASRNDGTGFTSLTLSLGQIFYIGDGLTGTGSGTVQQFFAPVGATRLFLGSADGFGWYNNVGEARITVNYAPQSVGAVPEPATWAMMIGGFGIAGMALRRRRKVTISYA